MRCKGGSKEGLHVKKNFCVLHYAGAPKVKRGIKTTYEATRCICSSIMPIPTSLIFPAFVPAASDPCAELLF